jgi:hypothetical protein
MGRGGGIQCEDLVDEALESPTDSSFAILAEEALSHTNMHREVCCEWKNSLQDEYMAM